MKERGFRRSETKLGQSGRGFSPRFCPRLLAGNFMFFQGKGCEADKADAPTRNQPTKDTRAWGKRLATLTRVGYREGTNRSSQIPVCPPALARISFSQFEPCQHDP